MRFREQAAGGLELRCKLGHAGIHMDSHHFTICISKLTLSQCPLSTLPTECSLCTSVPSSLSLEPFSQAMPSPWSAYSACCKAVKICLLLGHGRNRSRRTFRSSFNGSISLPLAPSSSAVFLPAVNSYSKVCLPHQSIWDFFNGHLHFPFPVMTQVPMHA